MRTAKLVLIVFGLLVTSCGSPTNAPIREHLAAPNDPALNSDVEVTGNGKVTLGGELRTFSFTAVQHADGTVSGEAELFNRITGFIAHADIICLRVIDNHAWIGGIITGHHVCSGTNMMFHVQDNGERNGDPPDLLSFAEVCDAPGPELPLAYCETAGGADQIPMFPVDEGSIVVHQ
jgi:hypothetical protein